MRSPTSSEDSQLVRIVVPCAQMRLPGPMDHRDAFSSSSERRKRRTFRQATKPKAKREREAMSAFCHGLVVDSMFKRSEDVATAQ